MTVVAITGASSGIGRALALAWGAQKACVVLSARNEVALARVAREVTAAGGEAIVEAGDVTDEAHRVALVARAVREKGRLDVLVNNAGRGYYAAARDVDVRALESLFALNVIAPLRLAQLALEPLARTSGTIVMVSSVAGVVAAPRMGAYAASKFALEALAMALRAEVAGDGIRVVVVRPGPVDTPFRANAVSTDEAEQGVRPPGSRVQTPEQIAALTLRAVARGTPVLETSAFVRVASAAARHAPAAFRMISARMARSKH
jgi:short-subunit dehydrogenase